MHTHRRSAHIMGMTVQSNATITQLTGAAISDADVQVELRKAERASSAGIDAAIRMFADITGRANGRAAARREVDEVRGRVAQGPAPVAYKASFDDSMVRLLDVIST